MDTAITRRGFLGAGLGAVAGALGGCGPAGPFIIDTHTHFYDPSRPAGVPWPPKDNAVLYRTVLPPTYPLRRGADRVAWTVVVEASPLVEDNQWILDLAAKHKFIRGLVGNLPIGTPAFAGFLDRFAKNPLFRGIRIRGMKLDRALEDDALLADIKRLADHDLSLDLVGQDSLPFAGGIADRFRMLRIVLDHLPGLKLDGGPIDKGWADAMESVAAHRNIFIKVSGLVEATGKRDGSAPDDPEFYHPALDLIWHVFGPDRLLYGSNWPVSEMYAPLRTVQRIALDYFTARGPDAVAKVFSGTAKKVYRWVAR